MGRRAASAIFAALIFILFLGPIREALDEVDLSNFAYASQLEAVLDPMPLLIVLGALVVLGAAISRGSRI